MNGILRYKNRSLRTDLIVRCMCLVVTMVLAMSGLFLIMRRENAQLRKMLEYKTLYNEYFAGISHLRITLLNYINTAHPDEAQLCSELANQCAKQAQVLERNYDHPQFTDQYYMALSLQKEVEDFLKSEESSKVQSYEKVDHMIELILNSEMFLTETEKTLMEKNLEMFDKEHTFWMAILVVIMMAAFIYGVWFSCKTADRTVKPLERLTEQVQKAEKEFLFYLPDKSDTSKDAGEMVVLSRAFYKMIDTIQAQTRAKNEQMETARKLEELKSQNMRMQVYLAQSEVCITQSLINPHFLFNCLNTISSMEYLEGAIQSREATQLVATFLRDALSRVGSIVCIREEMEHIQRYIEIQKLRFGERISYELNVGEDCMEAQIPSMSLQPVIENAIVHGVGDYKKDGRVILKVWRIDERIYVDVEDNGRGISPEQMKDIKATLCQEQLEEKNKYIGLRSTIVLLKSCFGEAFQFEIESKTGEYTRVDLKFPRIVNQEKSENA